jgi:hypothetical protein
LNDIVTLLYMKVYLQNKKVNEYSTKDFIRISSEFHWDFTRNYPRILLKHQVTPLYIEVYLQNKNVNEYWIKDFIGIPLGFHQDFIRVSLEFH